MRKLKKHARDIGVGAIGLGIMAGAAGQVGGTVAAKGQAGMTKIAGYFPAMGTIIGGGLVLRSLDKLKKSVPKRRRK